MTAVLLAGAVAGLGLVLAVSALVARGPSGPVALARLDLARERRGRAARLAATAIRDRTESPAARRLGAGLADLLASRGISLDPVRRDLAITGRSLESHLAQSLATAAAGSVSIGVAGLVWSLVVSGTAVTAFPLAGLAAGGLVGAVLPTVAVRTRATERRGDFRHTVGAFLDLVALNLAGGRGVPEALMSAAAIGDSPAMQAITRTLEDARLQGITPWAALGRLGDELGIEELVDLASALGLVADDGAKIRDSLAARAATLRRRELADLEGKAQERSQTMLLAQFLMCAGFLVFLIYPPLANVLASEAL
ncbi:MAG: type II secretion system F family protein [Kineosporiaceae bacterium]